MKLLGLILLAAAFSSSSSAYAESVTYQCELMIAAADAQDGNYDVKFSVTADSGSHGGVEREFKTGPHRVVTLADGKWLGISWFRNEKKIADGVTVLASDTTSERVMIFYNPANDDEQVSLDCK